MFRFSGRYFEAGDALSKLFFASVTPELRQKARELFDDFDAFNMVILDISEFIVRRIHPRNAEEGLGQLPLPSLQELGNLMPEGLARNACILVLRMRRQVKEAAEAITEMSTNDYHINAEYHGLYAAFYRFKTAVINLMQALRTMMTEASQMYANSDLGVYLEAMATSLNVDFLPDVVPYFEIDTL